MKKIVIIFYAISMSSMVHAMEKSVSKLNTKNNQRELEQHPITSSQKNTPTPQQPAPNTTTQNHPIDMITFRELVRKSSKL